MELVTCDTDCFGGVIGKGEWEREKVKEKNGAGRLFSLFFAMTQGLAVSYTYFPSKQ